MLNFYFPGTVPTLWYIWNDVMGSWNNTTSSDDYIYAARPQQPANFGKFTLVTSTHFLFSKCARSIYEIVHQSFERLKSLHPTVWWSSKGCSHAFTWYFASVVELCLTTNWDGTNHQKILGDNNIAVAISWCYLIIDIIVDRAWTKKKSSQSRKIIWSTFSCN